MQVLKQTCWLLSKCFIYLILDLIWPHEVSTYFIYYENIMREINGNVAGLFGLLIDP